MPLFETQSLKIYLNIAVTCIQNEVTFLTAYVIKWWEVTLTDLFLYIPGTEYYLLHYKSSHPILKTKSKLLVV